jgi:hypothetical protein
MVSTKFLDIVNNATVAQVIIRTLRSAGVDFNNAIAFVCDNAAYMKACNNNLCTVFSQTQYMSHVGHTIHSQISWRTI